MFIKRKEIEDISKKAAFNYIRSVMPFFENDYYRYGDKAMQREIVDGVRRIVSDYIDKDKARFIKFIDEQIQKEIKEQIEERIDLMERSEDFIISIVQRINQHQLGGK